MSFHLHFPTNAVRKDGPSAGIAIAAAIVSCVCDTAVKPDLAMTGEVSLVGRVLAVGGIKEKLLAAQRYGVKKVLLPHAVRGLAASLESEITQGLDISYVQSFDEVAVASFSKLSPHQPAASGVAPENSKEPGLLPQEVTSAEEQPHAAF